MREILDSEAFHPLSSNERMVAIEHQILQLISILPPQMAQMLDGCRVESATRAAERACLIRQELRKRRNRDRYFSCDMFADPAWDMLLDLYASRLEGRTVSVSSLCIAAAVPQTTALRRIKIMCDEGWLIRHSDSDDGRRIFISLSDNALAQLNAYFSDNVEGFG